MKLEIKSNKLTIAIIGAGPSGLVLGLLLRRLGHDTLLIDRETAAHRPVCGEYLSPQGVALLEELDLADTLRGFPAVLGMNLVSPSGKHVRAPFPLQRKGAALNRQIFQERLLQSYIAAGGVLLLGESLNSIKEESHGVLVATSLRELHCDAVIGADGRSSTVAKLMGWKLKPVDNPRVAIHAYLKPKKSLQNFGQMHILADHSYVGINPVEEQESNFSIVTDADRLQEFDSPKEFLNFQIRHHPRLSEFFPDLTMEKIKTTFPIRCQRAAIYSARVALIGDASGFIDPLTGEGITTGIKTAMLLAEAIQKESDIEQAIKVYGDKRLTEYKQKENFNWALQSVIRMPWLCELIALGLRWKNLNQLFIGVVGNIFTPAEAVRKFFNFKGESAYGQNNRGTISLSETQLYSEGGSGAPPKSLARSRSGARQIGKNLWGA